MRNYGIWMLVKYHYQKVIQLLLIFGISWSLTERNTTTVINRFILRYVLMSAAVQRILFKFEVMSCNSEPHSLNKLNYIIISCIKADNLHYLQCFVWKLLVGPLLELDVHSGVKGTGVHCLGSRQVDVLNHVGGNTFPQLLLQNGLPGRVKGESNNWSEEDNFSFCL